ncbi:MAG: C40 family peptidase [Prevotellaceae bacterium]|jgi:cell wall-associated NlpC family hydrolase|nr:C40 family peptidase [Prevotellaceae bacterium]
MKNLLFICAVSIVSACSNNKNSDVEYTLVERPPEIAEAALQYALQYAAANTSYHYGGQDLLKSIRVDCSGLIVNCYLYAVAGTPYALPFQDAAVADFFTRWTVKTSEPERGDLIFMGDNPLQPTHAALFVKNDSGYTHFIDATLKPEEMIDGVTCRKYKIDNDVFLSFGKLKLLLN